MFSEQLKNFRGVDSWMLPQENRRSERLLRCEATVAGMLPSLQAVDGLPRAAAADVFSLGKPISERAATVFRGAA